MGFFKILIIGGVVLGVGYYAATHFSKGLLSFLIYIFLSLISCFVFYMWAKGVSH